ncbi:Acetyltransferase (GNAT) domain-containing protein [Streptosporangium subroseum]|uniref:Acetyltransferase (GNAT) domain-containing protein n=1 Tax=Streptosporangium subroseum TaxID=106412 RepID=A0A239A919_9ACTN|nr:GNAT family N-acetyltransferase [Streptosporangium subroseum]SNR92146.1 Acetyltransferase (GNAT) domain-containing protein [Streptosporangium subroseum]
MDAEPIRTPRLTLIPLAVEHAAEMAEALGDPALHTFIGGSPATPSELRARYTRMIAGPPPGRDEVWLNWVIRLHPSQDLNRSENSDASQGPKTSEPTDTSRDLDGPETTGGSAPGNRMETGSGPESGDKTETASGPESGDKTETASGAETGDKTETASGAETGNGSEGPSGSDPLTGYVQATVTSAEASVAWVVGVPWQGRGIAGEAALALVAWLRERGVSTIVATVHPDHAVSSAVARRAGLVPTDARVDGEVVWTSQRAR